MSSNVTLEVAPRKVIGKQVNQLRRQGWIPGIIYGPTQSQPIAVQVEWTKLRPVLSKVGGTRLIDLQLDGKPISVLVRAVDRHPVRQSVLHVDFFAVDLNTQLKARVPIVIPNIEAVSKRLSARIFQPMVSILVECLPSQIPAQIVVDMSTVKAPGKPITVRDLPKIEGVRYLEEEDSVVVRTVSLSALAAAAEEEESVDEGYTSMEVEVIGKGKQEEEEEF